MATSYLSPGVYVEEVDRGSKPIEAVGTNTVGFLGESKAPTVARMVHATAVAIGRLLAVDSGIEKRGGDKMVPRFPDGLGATGVEGAVFVLLFLTVLVAWDGGALPSASGDEGACVAFLALRRGGGVAADFMVWMNSLK